jgi:hypothetical protein
MIGTVFGHQREETLSWKSVRDCCVDINRTLGVVPSSSIFGNYTRSEVSVSMPVFKEYNATKIHVSKNEESIA